MRSEPPRVSLFLILLVVAFVIMLAVPAFATDRKDIDIDIGTDVTTGDTIVTTGTTVDNVLTGGDLTGGDLVSGGNRAYSLAAPGLGDVDINQCLGSTAWSLLVGGRQKLVLNRWCAAADLDRMGLHTQAARIRCQLPEVRKLYRTSGKWIFSKYDMTNCVPEWTVKMVPVAPASAPEAPKKDEMEDYHREQQMALESLSRELEALKQEPQRVIVRPDPKLVERLDKEAERRAKARAILEGDK